MENPDRTAGFPIRSRFQTPGNDGKPDFPPRNAVENPLETNPPDVTKRSFARSFRQRSPDRTGTGKPDALGFRIHRNRETEQRTGAPRTGFLTKRTRNGSAEFSKELPFHSQDPDLLRKARGSDPPGKPPSSPPRILPVSTGFPKPGGALVRIKLENGARNGMIPSSDDYNNCRPFWKKTRIPAKTGRGRRRLGFSQPPTGPTAASADSYLSYLIYSFFTEHITGDEYESCFR